MLFCYCVAVTCSDPCFICQVSTVGDPVQRPSHHYSLSLLSDAVYWTVFGVWLINTVESIRCTIIVVLSTGISYNLLSVADSSVGR